MGSEQKTAAGQAVERKSVATILKFPKGGHARTSSGAGTMPHREIGAVQPIAFKADCITTKVSAGKRTKPRQLKAAPYERPVSLATAETPPRASITSAVVVSSRTMESASNPNFLDSQYPNLIDTKNFGYTASCSAMPTAGTDNDDDIALRCRALTRMYARGNSKVFATEVIDIGYTRWNNIERSGALSRDVARKICRTFPEVSLDWLYRGKDDGMTRKLSAEFLAAYRAEMAAAEAVKKKGEAA